MSLNIESIDHIQVTVPRAAESKAIEFYGTVLGLEQIDKPEPLRKNGGVWYKHGTIEIHVSPEDGATDHAHSKRHVCYVVADLKAAESELARHCVEIIQDRQPIAGWTLLYIRDPGGNRIEIAQRVPQATMIAADQPRG